MKPKILFIMHMPPPVHGAAMMGKYIHDSKVINGRFDCHYINLTTAKSLQDIGKGGVKKLWRFLCLLLRIVKGLVTVKPQLVYVTPNSHGGAFYKDFVVVQLIKLMGYRVIVHYHNKGVATRQDRWLDDKLYRLFFKNLKVILLAEALYKDVEKYVKRENVFVCPNGIPESLKGEPTAERNNVIPQLLFLSNLLVDKGVLVLLDALKILKDKGYSFVCHFVGGETAEIDAARFAEEVKTRGLDQMALFLGKRYGEEKNEEYGNADVFVFPSLDEAFPLVNLEAMEFKLPIVASDVGGVTSEVVDGENGFICKPGDTEAFVESIKKLLDDSDLRTKMGEAGYRRFKENFTLNVFENRLSKGLGGGSLTLAYFHGKKYNGDKNVFFDNADIFVFPTSNEAFGLVLLEAMEHAVPCISTREGGVSAIIDDGVNGFMVEKRDANALADRIEFLLTHPEERTHMGIAGYQKFKNEFTLPKFETRMKQILERANEAW